jgi:DNA-binding SARP family transcriptional activator
MRCLAHEGQPSAVAAAYHRCRASLQRHFGTVPSEVTEQLYRDACPDTTTRRAHEPLRAINGHRSATESPIL